jgi:predicted secreted hydrolase
MGKKYKEKFKKIIFPLDEQKHNHIIEWWYFNGNLKSKKGKDFSYMNCLFSTNPKKVNIPFLKNIPLKELYFSHYLLSNNKDRFENKINPICVMDSSSFKKPLLWASYDNGCFIKEVSPFKYHIINDFVDLFLESEKKPLLLNKTGFLDLKVKTTYYYSLTRLKTTGVIRDNKKWIEVDGLSWMDHQWAQTPLTRDDKWTWFSIQLNNNCEILCFIYGDEVKTFHASMLDEKNETRTTDMVEIKPKEGKYKNKKTSNSYFLEYTIKIPSFDLELETSPFKKDQEMIFGNIKYWEGGIKVEGMLKKKKVEGIGFSELLTFPRTGITKNLFEILKSNPVQNIKGVTDIGAKSIYFINQKIQEKF